jgi:hypothetical protein
MKYFILATATALTLSHIAIAKARVTDPDRYLAEVKNVSNDRQAAGPAIQIAMGPTSAAHYPIKQPNGNPPSLCTSSSDPDHCPKPPRKHKHRRP